MTEETSETSFPTDRWLHALDAPDSDEVEFLDARDLPPPKPLSETLERVSALGEDAVFLQLNDREPRFLYPKLDDRGYTYRTTDVEAGTVTAIWR